MSFKNNFIFDLLFLNVWNHGLDTVNVPVIRFLITSRDSEDGLSVKKLSGIFHAVYWMHSVFAKDLEKILQRLSLDFEFFGSEIKGLKSE